MHRWMMVIGRWRLIASARLKQWNGATRLAEMSLMQRGEV
jgi:hypothetical protein